MALWRVVALLGLVACGGRSDLLLGGSPSRDGDAGFGSRLGSDGSLDGPTDAGAHGGTTGDATLDSSRTDAGQDSAATDAAGLLCPTTDGGVEPVLATSFLFPSGSINGHPISWALDEQISSNDQSLILDGDRGDNVTFERMDGRLQAIGAGLVVDSWPITSADACDLTSSSDAWIAIAVGASALTDVERWQTDAPATAECLESLAGVTTTLLPGSFNASDATGPHGAMGWSIALTGTLTCAAYAGMPWSAEVDYSFTLQ